jgi:hypothetical protein
MRATRVRGVAQDRPHYSPSDAFCAVVKRLAQTPHKIMQSLANNGGSLRVGGSPPTQKGRKMGRKLCLFEIRDFLYTVYLVRVGLRIMVMAARFNNCLSLDNAI